jgi:hypothetical protein
MECRAALVYAALISPGLDLDEVRRGQLLTVLAVVSILITVATMSAVFSMNA